MMNTRLYRLTFSEKDSELWWERYTSSRSQTPPYHKRRIYRWGTMWGILQRSNTSGSSKDVWVAENRVPAVLSPSLSPSPSLPSAHVQEVVTRSQHRLPPPHVDDIWEEEVVHIDDVAEFNGLLSVTGTSTEIQAWCKKYNLDGASAFLDP